MWGILVPAGLVGGLSLLAARQVKARKNALTEKRKDAFERAMSSDLSSEKLHRMADDYEKAGLKLQANMLRKRAALRDMTPEEKERRREIYQKALNSHNVPAIEAVATAFERDGALGAAASLRRYSSGITELKADPKECVIEISDNHGHALELIPEDLLVKRTHSIKGEADHDHTVRLGPKALDGITVLSSETNGHTHKVTILCRPLQVPTSKPEDSAS